MHKAGYQYPKRKESNKARITTINAYPGNRAPNSRHKQGHLSYYHQQQSVKKENDFGD